MSTPIEVKLKSLEDLVIAHSELQGKFARLEQENKGLLEQIAELERLKGVKWRGPWKR